MEEAGICDMLAGGKWVRYGRGKSARMGEGGVAGEKGKKQFRCKVFPGTFLFLQNDCQVHP